MRWDDRRVLVTGGAGFLGGFVVARLRAAGCRHIAVPRARAHDLRDRDAVVELYRAVRPHIVIHLAAHVGGIGANRAHPGQFFYDNAAMGIHVVEYARQFDVEKLVAVGTICSYPKLTPVPFREEDLWNGYPEETNAPYALAKKMLLVQLDAYRAEYGFRGIYLLPVNLYGPRDHFDLETSHVIPAMIRKCVEAKERGDDRIALWGDGSPTREFLYVEDAADAIVLAAERYDGPEPVNIGSGEEIRIRDLAATIAEEVGFTGDVVWDTSRPNGQPRRRVDVSRAWNAFQWRARRGLRDGVRATVEWFLAQRRGAARALERSA